MGNFKLKDRNGIDEGAIPEITPKNTPDINSSAKNSQTTGNIPALTKSEKDLVYEKMLIIANVSIFRCDEGQIYY